MLNTPNRYVAAVLLSITTFSLGSYGQQIGPTGAPPGAGPPGNGPPPFAGNGPPSAGRADDADPPALVKRPKLSDKAPQPAADPRNLRASGITPTPCKGTSSATSTALDCPTPKRPKRY